MYKGNALTCSSPLTFIILHTLYKVSCRDLIIYNYNNSSDILHKNSLAVKKCEVNHKQQWYK